MEPTHLYIVSDGARKEKIGETILVEKCREIVLEINWKCDVKTLSKSTSTWISYRIKFFKIS